MKKFLSILLALAVGFTFTFGSAMSAFADDPYYTYGAAGKYATESLAEAAYLADVDDAEQVVLTTLKANYDIAVIKVTQNGAQATTVANATTAKIDKAYWLAQLEVEYNDVRTAVLNKTRELKSENWKTLTAKVDVTGYNSVTENDTQLVSGVYETEKYALAALKAGFADYQADAVKKIQSVDTSIYSATEYTESTYAEIENYEDYLWKYPTSSISAGDKTTYIAKEAADKTLAYAISLINAAAVDATRTHVVDSNSGNAHDGISEVYETVDDIVKAYATEAYAADGKTYAYTFKGYDSKFPYTVAQENYDKSGANAKAAAAKADMESKLSTAIYATRDYTAAQLAAWTVLKDAYIEVETAKIDGSATTVADFPAYIFKTVNDELVAQQVVSGDDSSEVTNGYVFKVTLVDKYEAFAAKLKTAKNSDGTVAYDSAKVDKILAGLIKTVYAGSLATDPVYTQFESAKLDSISDYAKNEYKAQIDNLMDADEYKQEINVNVDETTISSTSAKTYYAKEWADVEAAVDAYKAAIDAASTNADVNAAMKALKTSLDAVKTTSEIVYDTATAKAVDDAEEFAAAYVATVNAGKDAADRVPDAPADLTDWFKENGARNAAEVVALYDTLKTELAGKLSSNAMKAAVKELQDKIDALPAALLVKVTDSDQIVACKEAFEAFAEKYISVSDIDSNNTLAAPYATYSVNATALGKAYSALLVAKQKEIYEAEKAIAKGDCALVTVADKEAVKAVAELQNAYYVITENYCNVASPKAGTNADAWVKTALETIRDLEAKSVAEAINALPANITAENKEAVEAARKAYNAYVAEYTYYDTNNIYNSKYDAVDDLESTYNVSAEKLEAAEATINELTKFDDTKAKAYANDLANLKVNGKKLSNGKVKFTLGEKTTAKVSTFTDNGYTVKYSFYKAESKNGTYSLMKTKDTAEIIPTKGVKGKTYYFKVVLKVYDANGALVAKTYLGQADYGYAKWTAKTAK